MNLYRSMTHALIGSLAFCLFGCTTPPRTLNPSETQSLPPPAPPIAQNACENLDPDPSTLVVLTSSGGGTRAAAFTFGVLSTLKNIQLPVSCNGEKISLLDEVDVISSVSGGSVAAAHFALYGQGGFETFGSYLYQNGFYDLFWRYVNPKSSIGNWFPARAQIDVLNDWFGTDGALRTRPFADHVMGDLKSRPFLILNATDMGEGATFTFTQSTFGLICSDWARFPVASAVAGSAAFPIAFGPLTLKNQSYNNGKPAPGCAPANQPDWITKHQSIQNYADLANYRRGRRGLSYYTTQCQRQDNKNKDTYITPCKEWIHLLDGGIADNLGMSEVLWRLTERDADKSFVPDILGGKIRRIVLIVVNSRSEPVSKLEASSSSPGWIPQVLSVAGGAINSVSNLLLGDLSALVKQKLSCSILAPVGVDCAKVVSGVTTIPMGTMVNSALVTEQLRNIQNLEIDVLPFDFDFIQAEQQPGNDSIDVAKVQTYFKTIPTTWWLSRQEIDDLKRLPACLLGVGKQNNPAAMLVATLRNLPPDSALEAPGIPTCNYSEFNNHRPSSGIPVNPFGKS